MNIDISQGWEIMLRYQCWYIYHFSNVGILINLPMISQYNTTDIPVLIQNWYFIFFPVYQKYAHRKRKKCL